MFKGNVLSCIKSPWREDISGEISVGFFDVYLCYIRNLILQPIRQMFVNVSDIYIYK